MPTIDQAPKNQAKRRRWLRFSVRTFFLVITLLCVWLGIQVNAARRQKEAVAAILKAGGSIRYDNQRGPARGKMSELNPDGPQPLAPVWLRERIGVDYFCNVAVVGFNNRDVEPTTWRELTKLPKLRWLSIGNFPRNFDARDLEIIGQLSGLKEISLNARGIDGPALAALVNLKQLKILRLTAFPDDLGMEHVGKLITVEYLTLAGNSVTDSGFRHVQNLANLHTFELKNSRISDRTMECLKGLKNLRVLILENCMDRGDALNGLKQLNQLSELHLYGARDAPGHVVTTNGVLELRHELPNTKVADHSVQFRP